MYLAKKTLIVITIIVIATETLIGSIPNTYYTSSLNQRNSGNPVKVGVVFYRFDDPFVVLLMQSLQKIEEKNKGTIKFNFYDSKNDQAIQNQIIDKLLENDDIDLLILSLVDLKNDPKDIINKVKEKNIPVIFASKRTVKIDRNIIQSYDKAYYVIPDSEQGGTLQGKVIVNLWNKNKTIIDKNKDNIMQYIILEGDPNNIETIERTKYSIMAIEEADIKVEKLASKYCYWNEEMARDATEGFFTQHASKIEVIIANNDAMAIGAIKALQKYGYNNNNGTKTMPVFGIDAIPEAREYIKKGVMSGTIFLDPDVMAEAFYEVGMHLVYENTRFKCVKYKCDDSGRIIQLPFHEYVE